MDNPQNVLITTSPHLHEGSSTAQIMWVVVLCLVPAGLWGVFLFGIYSLFVLIVSIGAALVAEYVITRLVGKFTLFDGSAFLTGLLVGYNMPPSVPLYIPIIASVFAIAVVKQSFGGLGRNWMNPALAGRVFVMFSWTGPMTTWIAPRVIGGADAITAASPLGFVQSGLIDFSGKVSGPVEFLTLQGYGSFDSPIGAFLRDRLFSGDVPFDASYLHLFLGNTPGCIGEVSALFLLLGTIYLFIKKIITWEIPVCYLGSFTLLVWVFGGLRYDGGFFSGDIFFNLFSGGLILGACYMATDMVTSPLTAKGMIIFGVGAGFLTFLIRFYGSFPEGVSLAIILMNVIVPLIDRVTKPGRFGMVKEKKE